MTRNFSLAKIIRLVSIGLFVVTMQNHYAYATSIVCPRNDPSYAFKNADAVILATVELVERTESMHEIAQIKVIQSWKLKEKTQPKEIHAGIGELTKGMQLLFLSYDPNYNWYVPAICSPLLKVVKNSELNIDSAFYLKDLPSVSYE